MAYPSARSRIRRFHAPGLPSVARIAASPIKELVITDTIEYRFEPLPPSICVVTAAGLFAKAIHNIHNQTSVSALFET